MNPSTPAPLEVRPHFHAAAIAFSGRIRRPAEITIAARASAALPPTGGEVSRSESYGPNDPWGNNFSVEASVCVKGDYADLDRARTFTNGNHAANDVPMASSARVSLKNLKLTNAGPSSSLTLEIPELAVQLDSAFDRDEPRFALIPPAFNGLLIRNGKTGAVDPIDVVVEAAPFNKEGRSRSELGRAYNDASFAGRFNKHLYEPAQPGPVGDALSRFEVGGQLCCSLVTAITFRRRTTQGHRLVIPDFGQIYFCEMYVGRWTRRLTLMRIHLGSPDGGEFALGDVQTDGHRIPP
jgi:hypothetical protein